VPASLPREEPTTRKSIETVECVFFSKDCAIANKTGRRQLLAVLAPHCALEDEIIKQGGIFVNLVKKNSLLLCD
jgi:hypothetical protein